MSHNYTVSIATHSTTTQLYKIIIIIYIVLFLQHGEIAFPTLAGEKIVMCALKPLALQIFIAQIYGTSVELPLCKVCV